MVFDARNCLPTASLCARNQMDIKPTAPLNPVEIARAALMQMAERGLPPTPENYASQYHIASGMGPPGEPLEVGSLSPAAMQMIQGMLQLVIQSTGELAAGVDRFKADTGPLLANIGAVRDDDSFGRLVQAFTVATLSLHQIVDSSRKELDETRRRLEEVTGELKRSEELARLDPLTGFCNRRAMVEIVAREIAQARRTGKPFSIAILDVDHFKKVNDDHGHAAGDKALMHLAVVAKSGIRETDVICRYGGEEFVVMLPGANADGARFVIDRLRTKMENTPLVLEKATVTIRFSAGITELQSDEPLEALLERADRALYEAKRTGRNRVVVRGLPVGTRNQSSRH